MFLVGRSSENREGAAEPKMDVHEVEAGRCHGLTTQQDLMGPMIGDWFEFTVWFLSSSMSGKRYEVPESKPAGQKNGHVKFKNKPLYPSVRISQTPIQGSGKGPPSSAEEPHSSMFIVSLSNYKQRAARSLH